MDTQNRKIVVMGVSGCGKSTVGEHLAAELGLEYKDGDELHPQSNIDKMASGQALDDDDRAWWLVQVGKWLRDRDSGVIACSALKRSYRDLIRTKAPGTIFVHLHGDYDLLLSRMNSREDHFMPSTLLDSQFATLEPLGEDEEAKVFDIALSVDEIVAEAADWVRNR
ncbi:shikimate kinase [Corynebacterium efficiens YS-314]|uniref:gluconokinase n=1 Tax=Corynebacterium efficiens TaxID=152794 RepID=UPI0001B86C41|nr:gluconokinase [Corynebacterium efficiens]EEW49052.1 shikimate kinase [Corynebacterium efficiens YS-314]